MRQGGTEERSEEERKEGERERERERKGEKREREPFKIIYLKKYLSPGFLPII